MLKFDKFGIKGGFVKESPWLHQCLPPVILYGAEASISQFVGCNIPFPGCCRFLAAACGMELPLALFLLDTLGLITVKDYSVMLSSIMLHHDSRDINIECVCTY